MSRTFNMHHTIYPGSTITLGSFGFKIMSPKDSFGFGKSDYVMYGDIMEIYGFEHMSTNYGEYTHFKITAKTIDGRNENLIVAISNDEEAQEVYHMISHKFGEVVSIRENIRDNMIGI